jgi:hypothetical protein
MRKKLEADLISIAHRILQLKNKSDINQLYLETQKLYEKLAVLRFVEDHFGDAKPTIGQAEVAEKIEGFFEKTNETEFQTPIAISEPVIEEVTTVVEIIEQEVVNNVEIEAINKEDSTIEIEENNIVFEEITSDKDTVETIVETEEPEVFVAEIIEEVVPSEEPVLVAEKMAFEPIVEAIESVPQETPKEKEVVQISFDDLLGTKYTEPLFVKVTPSEKKQESDKQKEIPSFEFQKENFATNLQTTIEKEEPKSLTLNDKLVKEITIGLNDRIAFVKHLFGGSNEDYNRVLNQLITFDTFLETKSFIDEMVKPDYNNWDGKEDYEHRFMEIIEKKFLSF